MIIDLTNKAEIANEQTAVYNRAYKEHYLPVKAAGGTERAAERARVAFLATMGCTVKRVGRSNMVIWNDEDFVRSMKTVDELIAEFCF